MGRTIGILDKIEWLQNYGLKPLAYPILGVEHRKFMSPSLRICRMGRVGETIAKPDFEGI